MKIIELRKSFGDFTVDVNGLELASGKIHGLIGSNGCGKTTLAKLIMGTIPADHSNIDFDGANCLDITMMSQRPYMMHDTVYNNLIYPLKLRGIKPDRNETARWLSLCGLDEKAYARSLSSGQQQKLSIARSLIFGPKLVIVDESLSNLDLDSVRLFEREILRIQEINPVTWIIVSHQLAHIRRLCDIVHFMEKGRVLVSGSTVEVLENPVNPELTLFLKLSG